MRCPRRALLPLPLVVLLAASPADTIAQGSLPLQPGQRVRITAPELGLKRQKAVLDEHRGDRLLLTADSTSSIPVASITGLEVHRGTRGHPWRGAGIGFLVGAIAGGAATYAWCANTYDCNPPIAWAAAGIFGAGGALLGAGIGALARTDKWEAVPVEHVHVTLIRRPGGLGVGASLGF